ncbi:MAG: hypothetical protein AB7P04_13735 [Bacteriovoracia bacterium]
MNFRRGAGALLFLAALTACAGAQKKTKPELDALVGKKVALVDVDAEPTQRNIVEVALVNQLVKKGTFILVSKQDYEAAKARPEIGPGDWKKAAQAAGADFALQAKVLQFDAKEHEGYSREEVYDSQLAEERGEKEGKTQRLYKVKSLEGKIRVRIQFDDLKQEDTRVAVAEKSDRAQADNRKGAIHLPEKIRFMEALANAAFDEFFETYR